MSDMRKKIVILVAVIILGLLGFGVIKTLQSQAKVNHAKKISDTFVADVLTGKANESYALFSATAKKDTPSASWGNTVKALQAFFAGKQSAYKGIDMSPTYRIYTYTIPGTDSSVYTFRVVEGLENGSWAIQSFTSTRQT
jgi:hypothetical protein